MDIWISIHKEAHMANNLVKWWKTKFLNGYKQFSVECGDGKVSDTEELLGRLGSSQETLNGRLRAACTTPPCYAPSVSSSSSSRSPPMQTARSPPPTGESSSFAPRRDIPHQPNQPGVGISFDEFSCDVCLDNGDSKSDQDRQEFSFTLYDFDGHGKITKDDIAGLVTTIYEALGSSVKVPHYGSKTIQVKLTVSPDQRKHVSATIVNQKDNLSPANDTNKNQSGIRYKKDLNVTIRQNPGEKRRHHKRHSNHNSKPSKNCRCCKRHHEDYDHQRQIFTEDSSDICSRLSESVSSDDECCSEYERSNKPKKQQKKCHNKFDASRSTIPNLFVKDSTNNLNENLYTNKKWKKKRSGSLQRQELIDIIQANMDKNNLGFHAGRKHSNHVSFDTRHLPNDPNQQIKHHHHHHHKSSSHKMQTPHLQYLTNMPDQTQFYVDFGSLQNNTQLPENPYHYEEIIDAVMCVSNKQISVNRHGKFKKDKCAKVPLDSPYFQKQFIHYPMTNDENRMINKMNKKAYRKAALQLNNYNNLEKKTKNHTFAQGHSSSPHHLRPHHREEDQARAMAQVVQWLEQEFSSTVDPSSGEKQNKNKSSQNEFHHSSHEEKTTNTSGLPTSDSGAGRHEHHHVHEHIHHHYHHYQKTNLVV